MDHSLTVYSGELAEFIRKDFQLETLASDCRFTEGPVWHRDGNQPGYYLFSDITANAIFRISEAGNKEIFIAESGTSALSDPDLNPDQAGSNGLAFDKKGSLIACRHGSHDIARLENGVLVPMIDSYKGRPLNSPNDLVVHSDGRIWFSDPPYGLKEGKAAPEKFQPLAGVYMWKEGELVLVCDRYQYPNGVCLSPDEKKLYICSNKPFEAFISIYDPLDNSYLGELAKENSDGIENDRRGNIYLCNRDGIIILDQSGKGWV
jgi:gluconolactonase